MMCMLLTIVTREFKYFNLCSSMSVLFDTCIINVKPLIGVHAQRLTVLCLNFSMPLVCNPIYLLDNLIILFTLAVVPAL